MNRKLLSVFLLLLILPACQPPQVESINTPEPDVVLIPTSAPEDDSIVVSDTANSGPGSLRQALQDARYGDTITFDPSVFPPDNPVTIYVTRDALPGIEAGNLILDASNTGVILDGSCLGGDWTAGLQIVNSSRNQILGLQITNFTGAGIAVSGNSTRNIIGGDRSIGESPWGQGNLLSNNNQGINISTPGSTENTITGNLIGTDLDGSTWLGNEGFGIHICEGARGNTIGPDNIIAYNGRDGIYIDPPDKTENTVLENQLFGNAIGIAWPQPPAIFDFDMAAGTVVGASCPGCEVEIYSAGSYDEGLDGAIPEGTITADENGMFSFDNGEPFTGPSLTARTTNLHGRTGWLSYPLTSGTENSLVIQGGNESRRQYLLEVPSELADNHLGNQYDGISYTEDRSDFTYIYSAGMTRARVSNSGLEPELVDWDKPEFSISQAQHEHFTRLAENNIVVTYVLMFWDKENFPGGEGLPCYRFQTEEEIDRWLEYVRFTVEELGEYVDYFEIWNEPDIANYCPKSIMLDDYLNLIRRTAPVIREADPEAGIVIGAVSGTYYAGSRNYLFGVLESDVLPLVDVISFHPFYGESPKYSQQAAYYYGYPDFLQQIMDTAAANGFSGEFHADEVGWSLQPGGGQSEAYSMTETNKYWMRAVFLHRGMDVDLGNGAGYYSTRRVTTLMAGVEPAEFPVEIQSSADNIMSYTYSTLEGNRMIALWTNGIAVENDPGVEATITVPDFEAGEVVVIDMLNNLEQELVFEIVDGDLVIENLLVRDYPLAILFSDGNP